MRGTRSLRRADTRIRRGVGLKTRVKRTNTSCLPSVLYASPVDRVPVFRPIVTAAPVSGGTVRRHDDAYSV